jgi:hypothetical protein
MEKDPTKNYFAGGTKKAHLTFSVPVDELPTQLGLVISPS